MANSKELSQLAGVVTVEGGVVTIDGKLSITAGTDANHAMTKSQVEALIQSKDDLSELNGTTDDITEGSTNLYYTDARVHAALSASDGITYNSSTGEFTLTDTGVTAGSYGSASLVPVLTINENGQVTSASTVSVAGVSNFSYTAATNTFTIDTADGGSFSASGDLTSFDTGDLAEGSNLYWTIARGEAMFDTRIATKSTDDLSEGSNLYYTTARANADFDTRLATKTTDDLAEGSNLYYTDARARAAVSVTDNGGDGSLSYNSSTGEISYTGPSATEVRAHFSGGTGVDITDGIVSIGQPVATTDDVTFAQITADSVQFDTAAGVTVGAGEIAWNATDATFDMGLLNGTVLQVGQEQHFYAKAVGAIPNGAVVMFAGAQGGHVLVTLADLSSPSFEDRYLVGIATNSIANGEFGYITSFGKVNGLDTSAWAEGTILYPDPNVPGGLTPTAPVSPLHAVAIAAVTRQHAVVGNIMVRLETGSHLAELHDVYLTSPSNQQFIRYNATNSRWENSTVTTSTIGEGTNLYYTTARANTDFDTRLATKSTSDLAEGTNLYYTDARFDVRLATKSTTNLAEGTNLYFTDARARAAISVTDSGGDGSLSYNSTSGVITYTGPSATEVRAHLSAGTGVTYSSGQFSIGQAVATTSDVTFNSVTTAGDVTVGGNLTVNGTTTTVNATNLAISDNMIYLNEGSAVTNPDLGWSGNYNDGTYAHTGIFRDASDSGKFKFFKGYTPEPSSEIDTTHASFALADVVAASFTGSLVGNASTASSAEKWTTARTITLGGDLTGNVSIDGSANVTLTATVAANSVALGTDTTGNYVAGNTAGSYILVSGTAGEGWSPTIAVDATSANTASKVVARDASGNFSAGTITAALSGNASTATTLQTARTISLTGDVTGSVSFNGGSDVSIATTVAANSVALGTDTTGNYMIDTIAGGGIVVSHTQGEGSTATVSHADTSSVANLSSDNANGVVIQDVALTFDTYGHVQTATVATVDLDGRYYTETEADSRFVNVTGDTMTGVLNIQTGGSVPDATTASYSEGLTLTGGNMRLVIDTSSVVNGGAYIQTRHQSTTYPNAYYVLDLNPLGGTVRANGNNIWHAGNDGSGSGLDADLLDGQQGSYYLDWTNVTNKPDPVVTVTLTGDVTGSANTTLTDLASGTITVSTAVGDDSHNHTMLFKRSLIEYGSTHFQVIDQSGQTGTGYNGSTPYNPTNDWYHHLISNHANSGGYYVDLALCFHTNNHYITRLVNGTRTTVKLWNDANDGSGSGLDADLLDGIDSTGFCRYFEQTTNPGAVANGSIWLNTTTGLTYQRQQGVWVQTAPGISNMSIYDVNGTKVN